jgi:hypothetical protein
MDSFDEPKFQSDRRVMFLDDCKNVGAVASLAHLHQVRFCGVSRNRACLSKSKLN